MYVHACARVCIMEVQDDVGRRVVMWRARLKPVSFIVVTIWTALSFQQSVIAGVVAYLAAFILLGLTLLEGSFLYQLGLLLLLIALYYGLLTTWLKSQSFDLRKSLATNEESVLTSVCVHLARVDQLTVAAISHIVTLRTQHPVMFYVSGLVLVFMLGKLGYWLHFTAVLWMAVSVLLVLPAAFSRGWLAVPTTRDIEDIVNRTKQAFLAQISSSSPHH